MKLSDQLWKLYHRLWEVFGPQGWWPGESPFEIAVGAILTQNANWTNVTRVIAQLQQAGRLSPFGLHELSELELAQFLRPVGYYNLKARRLKNFLDFLLAHYQGAVENMARDDLEHLRPALLSINGIGPETADSILLYALEKPTFVVDAYTFRILHRHDLVTDPCSYEELRQVFMAHLPAEVALFKEYHALLVRLGKEFCRPRPRCDQCPLSGLDFSD
ncbi:MAG: endonuclease III domain-containing protein [Deltaproteobacteria bacterium]|nr:endonuclease III domain-containing protein [Deltaproteobacteria bacterium]MBW1952645.1 endonuclease III domain-containing protein [Deltaproteobacteria bacterium]MBW1986227.1 endonuclease III domain-containing protein [Deltaproteobacteria bacterium]MBW2134124.1 endonuclease III domain-containing protein [Deltaproteobacteria bacterium]